MMIIKPHVERTIRNGMSYGESVASYDFRLAENNFHTSILPHSFTLLHTLELFDLPNGIAGQIMDKSSWARKGISLFNTWIDPGFRGHITVEVQNNNDYEIFIPPGDPLGQIVFFYVDRTTEGYAGKYQDQPNKPVEAKYE
jgi:dCTP deaminase